MVNKPTEKKSKKENEKNLDIMDPLFKKNLDKAMEDIFEYVSKLYDAATTDKKTDTYAYKFFKSTLELEIEKAKRGQPLSIMIIDIDFFKKINDTYGHFEGDKILIQLASILKRESRSYDIVSRFGGEEFVILFQKMPYSKAKKVALRMKNKVKKDPYLKKYNLTFSGGLTEYKKGDTTNKMLDRADKALYKAKKAGRDKLFFAETKTRSEEVK